MVCNIVLAAGPPEFFTNLLMISGALAVLVGGVKAAGEGYQMAKRGAERVRNAWLALTKPWRLVDQLEERIEELEEERCKPGAPDKS